MKARDIIPGWPKGRTTSSARVWYWVPRWGRVPSDEEIDNIQYHILQGLKAREFIEEGKPMTLDDAFGGRRLGAGETDKERIIKMLSSVGLESRSDLWHHGDDDTIGADGKEGSVGFAFNPDGSFKDAWGRDW